MLAAQSDEIHKTLDRLEASLAASPAGQKFNRLSLQLRIQQLRSLLDWFVECGKAF